MKACLKATLAKLRGEFDGQIFIVSIAEGGTECLAVAVPPDCRADGTTDDSPLLEDDPLGNFGKVIRPMLFRVKANDGPAEATAQIFETTLAGVLN